MKELITTDKVKRLIGEYKDTIKKLGKKSGGVVIVNESYTMTLNREVSETRVRFTLWQSDWPTTLGEKVASYRIASFEKKNPLIKLKIVPYKDWLKYKIKEYSETISEIEEEEEEIERIEQRADCNESNSNEVTTTHDIIAIYDIIKIQVRDCPIDTNNCLSCKFLKQYTREQVECKYNK